MLECPEPIAWKATSLMVFNQTARMLGKLKLFGVPQKLGRAPSRNSASSTAPRRHPGCSHQRKRAKNKSLADPKGRPLFHLGDNSKTNGPRLDGRSESPTDRGSRRAISR